MPALQDSVVFLGSNYLASGSPYPMVIMPTVDTSAFANVMNYGAKGDGKTLDDSAIKQAFQSGKAGVLFPPDKTYLVSKLSTVSMSKDCMVYAVGATVKMADAKRYSWLDLEYGPEGSTSYNGNFGWIGGRLDGNKDKQSWPDSPSGNDAWAEDHGQFVRVEHADKVFFKDVELVNMVSDGLGTNQCRVNVFADCKASAGAPIQNAQDHEQSTYFKVRGSAAVALYAINLTCNDGSIGIQYSTKNLTGNANAFAVLSNCKFYNQLQNPGHFEDCKKLFMIDCEVDNNNPASYSHSFHISNRTEIASIKNSNFKNVRLNFNNGSSLRLAIIDGCSLWIDSKAIPMLIEGKPTIIINSKLSGIPGQYQAQLKNARNCTFENFGALAIDRGLAIDTCTFINGNRPATFATGGFITNSIYNSVQTQVQQKTPTTSSWKEIFDSIITIKDENGSALGTIAAK